MGGKNDERRRRLHSLADRAIEDENRTPYNVGPDGGLYLRGCRMSIRSNSSKLMGIFRAATAKTEARRRGGPGERLDPGDPGSAPDQGISRGRESRRGPATG